MQAVNEIDGLAGIADRFDAIFCDVWGVVHNGRKAFPGSIRALQNFRKQGGRVILITNAPVPREQVERYFEPFGVPRDAYDSLVSSGDTTRAWLAERHGSKVLAIGIDEGWERDRRLYDGLDLDFVTDPEAADFIVAMGLRDGFNDRPETYQSELEGYLKHGLPMVVPNPDLQVRVGERLHWCGGILGKMYASLGGDVILTGKPHPPIYQRARELLDEVADVPPAGRTLAIGDGPATDIRGANQEKMPALYVGTGLHAHDGDFIESVSVLLSREGVTADFAMPELDW